ncbi:MAG: DUF262 domain-containing protein [Bacillota bacterium]
MSLENEINKHSTTVSTDSYSMSVGELVSMYRDGELDLHPEFQRFFRWTDEQKSKFIESLLLGIPIPPIFVSERNDAKWDVIDGLQRLSTILQVMGELRNEDNEPLPPLELTRTRYLPSLEGKKWTAENSEQELPESARIKIKRARLDVNIVKSTSDEIAKYEIFQRLNTGGTKATDQEVRNCILIMNNREFYQWIRTLGEYENFRNCIIISDRAVEEAFDLELVTRFIVLTTCNESDLSRITELGSFLTDELVNRAIKSDFEVETLDRVFKQTFDFLADSLEQNSFRRYDSRKKKYVGGTLISLFEIVAIGIGHRLLEGREVPSKEIFLSKHQSLWEDDRLSDFIGSGVRASTRLPRTVAFGRRWLEECR